MRAANAVLLSAVFASSLGATALAATASGHARSEGRVCTVADRGGETWFGYFEGKRKVFAPLKGGGEGKAFEAWRCFATEAECGGWTSGMLENFPAGPNSAFCRKGG
jgi:hypothetical protein